ncbi:hypothetical protein ABZS88_44570 [Streptomyces sp. NPDC005480]|uniref:hypothetical protein n=1 Tax=Streptomyces sp. NPDC005480 TaxID=3154880 RepID=UPI0033B391CB
MVDVSALRCELSRRVDGEVRFDAGSPGAYATDGSNYRQVPLGVVVLRTADAGAETIAVGRIRCAGAVPWRPNELAGQCTNAAVVINWTKYCDKLVSVVVRRMCVVEPGILPEELNLQLSGYQPKFGAKPSIHSHCSLAGRSATTTRDLGSLRFPRPRDQNLI